MPEIALKEIITKANDLINTKDGILIAASSEIHVFTVKSCSQKSPHIVQPKTKNKNDLFCDCSVFAWYKMCHHGLAASFQFGFSFDYLIEARKKLASGKESLTDGINHNLSVREKGLKKNEIQKAASNLVKSQRKSSATITSAKHAATTPSHNVFSSSQLGEPQATSSQIAPSLPISQNQPSNNSISFLPIPSQPNAMYPSNVNHSMYQIPTPYMSYLNHSAHQINTNNINPFNNTQSIPHTWNSGLSPFPYELILLPK